MSRKPERIVVVGGGSAGWMVAALVTGLNGSSAEAVESEDIGIVAVGKATLLSYASTACLR